MPRNPALLAEYTKWITSEGLESVKEQDLLTELRVYRNVTGGSPVVTTIATFRDMPAALVIGRSTLWERLLGDLTRYGCEGIQVTLLEPSPLMPHP